MLATGLEKEGKILPSNLNNCFSAIGFFIHNSTGLSLSRRGLIMGIWNSHTSVGNILGSAIAGIWASHDW